MALLARLCAALVLLAGCADARAPAGGAAAPNPPPAPAAARDTCLPYAPHTVSITGTLERRTYPGRPNYGESPDDERETHFYVVPDAPLCTGWDPDSVYGRHSGVRLVQLVLDSAGYASGRPYLNTRVRATGTLFGWHTGHHHAPLLLEHVTLQPVP